MTHTEKRLRGKATQTDLNGTRRKWSYSKYMSDTENWTEMGFSRITYLYIDMLNMDTQHLMECFGITEKDRKLHTQNTLQRVFKLHISKLALFVTLMKFTYN